MESRLFFKISDRRDFIKEIELYPERQDDGRILKQLSLGFPVFYEGSEGDTIRLLKQNTVETVVLLTRNTLQEAEKALFKGFPRSGVVTLRLAGIPFLRSRELIVVLLWSKVVAPILLFRGLWT